MLKQKLKLPVIFLFALTVGLVFVFSSWLHLQQTPRAVAATSSTLNFQARLMRSAGSIAADGDYNVEFKLYNALTSSGSSQGSCTGDSACLWTETRTSTNKVRVVNGYLTVNLGSVTAFPTNINWDQDLYISLNIGGTGTATWDGEMSPRLKLTAVPYAFRAGQLAAVNGSFTSTLGMTTPTANRTILAPDESGTICLQSSTNCGFALSTGSGSYIQNGTSLQSGANFNISGTGTAATSLQAPLLDTASAAALNIGTTNATSINLNKGTTITGGITQSGGAISLTGNAASSVNTTTGALTLQSVNSSTAIVLTGTAGTPSITMNTGSSGSISIGTTSLTSVTLGSAAATTNIATTNVAHTLNIANGGTSTNQVVTIGSTNTGSTTTVQGGTSSTAINLTSGTNGSINLTTTGTGKNVIKSAAGTVVQDTSAGNTSAFQVQNSGGGYILNVDTSANIVNLGYLIVGINGSQATIDSYYTGGLTIGASIAQAVAIGNTAAAVTIQGTSASTFKGTSGSFTTTLGFTTPTANRAINLPNEAGTLCIQTSTNCGFAASSGSANYIQNTTTAQSANMYVQAASSGSVAGVLRANAAGTGDILDLKNGAGTNIATFGSTGAVLMQNSTDSLSAFAINTSTGGTNQNVFRVDTSNERVAVGVISDPIGAKLSVATGSTVGFRVYQGGSSDTVQMGNATADFFKITNTGAMFLQNTANSTTAFRIQNALATSNVIVADTTNTRIAIGQLAASYTLDVAGDINTSTQLRIGGTTICDSTGCTAKTGSGFYIHNQTTAQSANMYVQAASSGSVTAVLQANASGSGDILDLKDGSGNNVATFGSAGATTLKTTTNSSNAFQVQNASGGQLLNVNSSNSVITLNGGAGGGLNAWTSTSSMSTSGSLGGSVVMNGYVYNIGGYASAYSGAVRYAPIKANGTLGTWNTTTALGGARGYTAAASSQGYLYVMGGTDGSSNQNTIYIAKQSADGTLANWQTSPVTLPSAMNATAAYVVNGYLYILGGSVSGSSTTATYYTHINGDGSINSFNTGTALPVALANGTTFAANGYLYYMGGINGSGTTVSATYYTPLNVADGSIGSWTSTTALPSASANFASVVLNGNVYIIRSGATVSYAPLNSTGTIGTWVSDANAFPVSYTGVGAVTYNGYIYAMGGYNGTAGTTAVYYTSGARTMVAGSLDLVGLTAAGALTGDATQESGSVGGTLTAGNTTVVGTLQVQGQSNFNQNVSINGNSLTVGNNIDSTSSGNTLITVQSRGFAGLELYGDSSNDNTVEGGGAYVLYSTDGILGTEAISGLVQQADLDPSAVSYTGAVANNMLVGTRSNFALQLGTNSNVRMTVMNSGNVCIGVATCTKKLGVSGTIGASGAITASTTPDIAETIAAADDVEAADVVMADPNNTERVVKSDRAYNTAAVGVISDGTSSFMINSYGGTSAELTGRPLVLAGRVPVKVSGVNGAIKPGDYLTSSDTPGYAMKATHAGPTIGKALGYFNGSTGTVLVLVNLGYYNPSTDIQGTSEFQNINVAGNVVINGDLTVKGATNVGTITIDGHIITQGNAPQIQLTSASGQNASATVTGNDTSGVVTITAGSQSVLADDMLKVLFSKAYGASPRVVLTPVGKDSAQAGGYVDQTQPDSFMIGVTNVTANGKTYVFNYQVMQ